jgi:hypothetical protein
VPRGDPARVAAAHAHARAPCFWIKRQNDATRRTTIEARARGDGLGFTFVRGRRSTSPDPPIGDRGGFFGFFSARERDGAVMALARAIVRKKATSGAASTRRRRE